MLESVAPMRADVAYGGGAVTTEELTSSYDDPSAPFGPTESVIASWSIADHINAAVAAGLTVDVLLEHDSCEHDPRGLLTPDPDGRYRLHIGPKGAALPLLYTLIATLDPGWPSRHDLAHHTQPPPSRPGDRGSC